MAFLIKVKELLLIAVPGFKSYEMMNLIFLSLLLILRTYLSIELAEITGKIVKSIVNVDF
jgi:hypothetical protein